MKKEAAIVTILFLFLTSTALAAPGKQNVEAEHADQHASVNHNMMIRIDDVTIAPTDTIEPSITTQPSVSPSISPMVKNHGEYVSGIAQLHLGGSTVSEAAKSDIGKKHHDDNDNDGDDDLTPTTTPHLSPTIYTTPAPTVPVTGPMTEAGFHLFPDLSGFWNMLTRFIPFMHNEKHKA